MRAEGSFIVVSQRSTSLLCAEMAIEEFGKLAAERLKIGPVALGALLVEVDSDGSGAIDAQEFNRVRTRVIPIRSKAAQLGAW